ncbi:MAG: DUF354 domain-containing protein [Nitrososphaerota archaeon]|nr:DUF354 domain-containing protein [Nitrososphaerota archaeon]MDG6912749.1 DUF354 domain-containing protein [Nitrososphaerota archaeon]MDG6924413.1 DUF354 domain-containing protein [Nitrososphaerota archaeon]MDG6941134.1 DUF354 domain-containing protein [Nitrososphaerota archaeon]MDG6971247.1 DUF354 domain-containing protein [Nitrososphaerota archaeon]
MRVWFDVLTPKQVLFFGPMVAELTSLGAEVLVTSRRYREVGPLAARAGLDMTFVGERGRKGKEEQLLAATRRQEEMIPLVKRFGPNVAVSTASAVCARVAFGLGIKHVAVNDSPHSEVAGRLSLPLSHRLLCPWVIPYGAWAPYGLRRDQVTTYRALDPAAWLKRPPISGPVPGLDRSRDTITVRFQESDAPYLARADMNWSDRVLASLAEEFSDANIVALCRYDYQVEEVKGRFGSRVIVPEEVVGGHDLLAVTDLFVGMGGTMSAEAALMGVPTISAFQGSLYTDRYLMKVGLLEKAATPSSIVSKARRLLEGSTKAKIARRARSVLDSMEDPVLRVATQIEKTAKQA